MGRGSELGEKQMLITTEPGMAWSLTWHLHGIQLCIFCAFLEHPLLSEAKVGRGFQAFSASWFLLYFILHVAFPASLLLSQPDGLGPCEPG